MKIYRGLVRKSRHIVQLVVSRLPNHSAHLASLAGSAGLVGTAEGRGEGHARSRSSRWRDIKRGPQDRSEREKRYAYEVERDKRRKRRKRNEY